MLTLFIIFLISFIIAHIKIKKLVDEDGKFPPVEEGILYFIWWCCSLILCVAFLIMTCIIYLP